MVAIISSTAPFAPKSISGTAVDFYLANATVKFDDRNGLTTTTGAQGHLLETTADCNNSAITITGGTDIEQDYLLAHSKSKTDLQKSFK